MIEHPTTSDQQEENISYIHNSWPTIVAWLLILTSALSGAWRYGESIISLDSLVQEDDMFSAKRALIAFDRIFPKDIPHPIGSSAHQAIYSRICQEFRLLNYRVETQQEFIATRFGTCGTVKNIIARKGKPGTNAVLLMTHYDSVPAAPGASDAGAAVASLLEIAHLLSGDKDIVFLCTDGEEAGMMGAQAFTQHPWFQDVRFVINLEARGTSGAAILFEFIGNTGDFVKKFASRAPRPVTNSLAQTVYDVFPNDTDLSIFRNFNIPGINFAFIGSATRYHTGADNRKHLNVASVQHLGESALVAVDTALEGIRENSLSREREPVFFDAFGFFLVSWPRGLSPWFAALALIIVIIVSIVLQQRKLLTFIEIVWATVIWWCALLGGIGVAFAIAMLLTWAGKVPPLLPFPASPFPILIAGCAISITSTIAITTWLGRKTSLLASSLTTWFFWNLIALLLSIFLEGVSYLFLLPALGTSFSCIFLAIRQNQRNLIITATLLPVIMLCITIISIISLLTDAIGLGPISGATFLFAVGTTLLIPVYLISIPRWCWLNTAIAFSVMILSLIVAWSNSPYDADNPLHLNLAYHEHHSDKDINGRWFVATFGETLPQSFKDFANFSKELTPLLPYSHPWTDGFAAKVEPQKLEPPVVKRISQKIVGGQRFVELLLSSKRGAPEIIFGCRESQRIKAIYINNTPVPLVSFADRWSAISIKNAPTEGISLRIRIVGKAPLQCHISDQSFRLPDWAQNFVQSCPKNSTPVQNGNVVVVSKSIDI